jgi:hypothetical protein
MESQNYQIIVRNVQSESLICGWSTNILAKSSKTRGFLFFIQPNKGISRGVSFLTSLVRVQVKCLFLLRIGSTSRLLLKTDQLFKCSLVQHLVR